jgi:hypothetical protein
MLPKRTGKLLLIDFILDFFKSEVKSWRGEQPLWKVFWGYGVFTSGIIAVFYAFAFYGDDVALQQALLACFAAYTFWILVSIWRCAKNTEEKIWEVFARLLTVAWAGNTIMVLIVLQLDLIKRYFGL